MLSDKHAVKESLVTSRVVNKPVVDRGIIYQTPGRLVGRIVQSEEKPNTGERAARLLVSRSPNGGEAA